MRRIKHLSLNLFYVLSLGLSASYQASLLPAFFFLFSIFLSFLLCWDSHFTHLWGRFCTLLLDSLVWKYYRLCLCDTSEGAVSSEIVPVTESWFQAVCRLRKPTLMWCTWFCWHLAVYYTVRGTGTWVMMSLNEPKHAEEDALLCWAILFWILWLLIILWSVFIWYS